MKKQILLYPGDGIGPELFEALRIFFEVFKSFIEFKYISDLREIHSVKEPYYLLCGPLSEELDIKGLSSQKEWYGLSIVPLKKSKPGILSSTRILTLPLDQRTGKISGLKDFNILSPFFLKDQEITLVHTYKQEADKWTLTFRDWSKLTFASSDFRLEDCNFYSFIRQGVYKRNTQIITSSDIEQILTGIYASFNDSFILSHKLFIKGTSAIALPVHGHAPDIIGMGIANPYAIIMAFFSLLNQVGYTEILQNSVNQIERMIFEQPDYSTPDQNGILNTEKYIAMIVECINLQVE